MLLAYNSFAGGFVMSGIRNSVTDCVLDACSDDEKEVLAALDFGGLPESEDSVSEVEL